MNTKRIFFAIFPPPDIVQKINELIKQLNLPQDAHITADEKLHITLLFLGECLEDDIQKVSNMMQNTKFPAFNIQINQLKYLEERHMLWLTADNIPETLSNLAYAIKNSSKNLSQDPGKIYPFLPHITLVKRLKDFNAPELQINFQWQVAEYSLVESVKTEMRATYRVLEGFPLAAPG
jgi:2'-5' RNA ligase